MDGGGEAEDDAGDDGEQKGEQEDAPVERGAEGQSRGVGEEAEEAADGPGGDEEADGAAGHREEHAFGDELAKEVAAMAPTARRMAISFWRPTARASSRLATLAQAIRSRRATIAERIRMRAARSARRSDTPLSAETKMRGLVAKDSPARAERNWMDSAFHAGGARDR